MRHLTWAALVFLSILTCSIAHAATFTVTKLGNTSDGVCNADCSLNEAVSAANAAAGADTINFAVALSGTIMTGNTAPSLSDDVTINGPGASVLVVSGDKHYRVFSIASGKSVTMAGLTISNGFADINSPDGIFDGGGILNAGALALNNCVIRDNKAFSHGGGISSSGALTMTGCTVSNNSASYGGGITNWGTATATNCTFSGNHASSVAAGIDNAYGRTLTVINCTVSGNILAPDSGNIGGGIYSLGTLHLKNSLVVGNVPNNVNYTINTDNHNIRFGTAAAAGLEVDGSGNPVLKDNGGPTPTIALLPGSPALDAGNNAVAPATDQRGLARPQNSAVDIGAVEMDVSIPQLGTLYVTTTADSDDGACTFGDCTLREAINVANATAGANAIGFAPAVAGTITLTGALPDLSDDVTISGPGAAALALSGNDAVNSFHVMAGRTVTMSGLTLRDGSAVIGGAIRNDGTLTLANCTLSGNAASGSGGGIYSKGQLTATDCTLSGNSAASSGGGIYNTGTLSATGCIVTGNTDGISNHGGTVALAQCTLTGNLNGAIGNGGTPGATLTATNCTVSDGTINYGALTATNCTLGSVTNSTGGNLTATNCASRGIFNEQATLSATNCTVSGNAAIGIHNSSGLLTVTNCTIVGGSEGLRNFDGTATVTNCTVRSNATYGIRLISDLAGSTLTAINCTVIGNATGIATEDGMDDAQATLTVTNCTVSGNTDTGIFYGGGNFTLQNSVVAGNPTNVRKSGGVPPGHNITSGTAAAAGLKVDGSGKPLLKDNGGPTQTVALVFGGAAVDSGDNALAPTTDQRGVTRPQNGTVDIGAYEADFVQSGLSFTVNSNADSDDGACTVGHCTLREAINAANTAASANTIGFAPTVTGAITLTNDLPQISDAVIINGPGAAVLAVSGNDAFRIFSVGAGKTVAISGLMLRNGSADAGGGIFNEGALALSNCILTANTATAAGYSFRDPFTRTGGGIYNSGTLKAANCLFSDNLVRARDGEVWEEYGNSGEYAEGGAIWNGGTLTLADCTFSGNSAQGGNGGDATVGWYVGHACGQGAGGFGGQSRGGAIFNAGTLSASACTFSANTARGGNGAWGEGTFEDCNGDPGGGGGFGGDGGNGGGGGIATSGTLTLTNCTLSGNGASGGDGGTGGAGGNNDTGSSSGGTGGDGGDGVGGAVAGSGFTLTNCTLTGNATGSGIGGTGEGGINGQRGSSVGGGLDGNALQLRNSIVTGNSAAAGADVHGTVNTNDHNIVGTDAGLDPAGLQDNGGPTQTIALLPGSLAINAGNDDVAPATDQRGLFRAGKSDIGAYEVAGQPAVTINDVTISEGPAPGAPSVRVSATFTVSLSWPSVKTVTVQYATATPGSYAATPGADYVAVPPTTLTFAPGETAKQVTVQIIDDTLDENYERFAVNLSNPTNAKRADGEGFCTILDDDGPMLGISDVSIVEGNPLADGTPRTTNATFTVSLSAPSPQKITVQYATAAPGSYAATAGADYRAVPPTTLSFAPGQTGKQVMVKVNGDLLDEINERFVVNLSNATNATIADSEGFGTIVDDDATPCLGVNDVSLREGNAGMTAFDFMVSLSAPSGQTVTVKVATTTPGSTPATAGTDYVALPLTTLSFASGETTKTVTVLVNGDTQVEGTERFLVKLSAAAKATLSDSEGRGTILEDDTALSIGNVTLTEDNPPSNGAPGTVNAVFTVMLSAASPQTVTVQYATGTPDSVPATAGADYVAVPLTILRFAPGETSKQVAVKVNGDLLDEADERFAVNLSGANNATIADGQGFCTIVDDDAAPSLRINDVTKAEGPVQGAPGGTTAFAFSVTLSVPSGKTVTVKVSTTTPTATPATPGIDYIVLPLTPLIFAPGQTTKLVVVHVNGDTQVEGNEKFVVRLSSAANATIADSEGFGTILNDDAAAPLSGDEPSE